MSFGKIILDYGDSLIRESEIHILKTNQWLNDAVIGFYFEYLSNHSPNDKIVFYGPGVTQLLKLLPNAEEVQCILGEVSESTLYGMWPVNDSSEVEKASSGSHWSLLVFSRPDNKFLHYDSWGGANEFAARKLFQKLTPFIASTATFQSVEDCAAQANGRDCGLHVLENAQQIKAFVSESSTEGPSLWKSGLTTASPVQAEKMRTELLQLIESLSNKTKSKSS